MFGECVAHSMSTACVVVEHLELSQYHSRPEFLPVHIQGSIRFQQRCVAFCQPLWTLKMSSRLLASVWIECNYGLGVRQPMKYLLISLHFSIFIILSLAQTKTKILEAFLELSFWIRKISHRLQQRHPSCPASDSAPSECIWKGSE